MYMSFYTGYIGAQAATNKLSVVSNNLANINNTGFKPKTAVFSELINYNLNDSPEAVTELQAGASVKVDRTNTEFGVSAVTQTGSMYDFAIMEPRAFFMLQDVATGEITYTRDGDFHKGELDGQFYLTAENGKLVLDRNRQRIPLEDDTDVEELPVGIFTFENPSRLLSVGDNEYTPAEEDMAPILIELPEIAQGALESSSTDMAKELVDMIESQRAFSYAVRMVTTSDETVQTINSLRT